MYLKNKRFGLILSLVAVFVLMLAACQPAETDDGDLDIDVFEPTADPTELPDTGMDDAEVTDEPEDEGLPGTGLTPSVDVSDQAIEAGIVTIDSVVSDGPGWLVVHADQDGSPGPVLGWSVVEDGSNENVAVEIDESQAGDRLHAMLHTDAGTVGEYEFPGDDTPVQVDGQVVNVPFMVTGLPVEGDTGQISTTEVGLELVAEGFVSPLVFTHANDDSGRMFVADQIGVIRVLDENGQLLEEPFLDIRESLVELREGYDERGLLGLAFHPNYAENGRFFVYYSAPLREEAPDGWNHTSHISEFQVSQDDPNQADPDSERLLLQVDQPQGNHDGGQIAFGPDGYLYIPLGDGGAADDVAEGHVEDWYEDNAGGNGQDISQNLLGSILRIDIDNGDPYGIPEDNPFVGDEDVAGEQYAYGFRNPYRIAFDSGGNNDLYVGDAGQNRWEEVSIVQSGGNYGWNVKEGTHCFDAANPDTDAAECPDTGPDGEPLIDPVIEYANANQPDGLGLVVVGGNVYRGTQMPEFEGMYFFGDWSTSFQEPDGKLLVAAPSEQEGELWQWQEISIANQPDGNLNAYLLSFGEDAQNELYVLTTGTSGPSGDTGKIWRIVPAGEAGDAPSGGMQATATPTTAAGAGMGEATDEPAAEEALVMVVDSAYEPAELNVPAGTTVVWEYAASATLPHTVTADNGEFNSGTMNSGDTFEFTFNEPGSYLYYCEFHGGPGGQGMSGVITVTEQ